MVSIDRSSECEEILRTVPDSCSDWEQAQHQHQQLTELITEAAAPDAQIGGMTSEGMQVPCPGDAINASCGEAGAAKQVGAQTVA